MDTDDCPDTEQQFLHSHIPLIKKPSSKLQVLLMLFREEKVWLNDAMPSCSRSCQTKQMAKSGSNSDKGRQGRRTYPCVCREVQTLECSSFFSLCLFSCIFPSPSVAPFINQPFIKQKQLPALPKRCRDNLDMKTEYLPSLP